MLAKLRLWQTAAEQTFETVANSLQVPDLRLQQQSQETKYGEILLLWD